MKGRTPLGRRPTGGQSRAPNRGDAGYVVDAVRWCDGDAATNVIGCGSIGAPPFMVERLRGGPPLEGLLWAHEFGHNVGLPHRPFYYAIMRSGLHGETKRVNDHECRQYVEGPSLTVVAERRM